MKVDKTKLLSIAVEENSEEQALAKDLRANRSLYKASMRIAMKIKRALKEKGLTQNQLATKMNVDPAAMSRFLSGKSNLELKTILRFEEELGINIIDRSISPFSDERGKSIIENLSKSDESIYPTSHLLTVTKNDNIYDEILETAETSNMVNEEVAAYSHSLQKLQDIQSGLEYARMTYYNEGMEKGRLEGLRESAKNMLKANMNPSLIQEITGLSLEEIQSL